MQHPRSSKLICKANPTEYISWREEGKKMEVLGDLLCRHEKNIKKKRGLSKCAFKR